MLGACVAHTRHCCLAPTMLRHGFICTRETANKLSVFPAFACSQPLSLQSFESSVPRVRANLNMVAAGGNPTSSASALRPALPSRQEDFHLLNACFAPSIGLRIELPRLPKLSSSNPVVECPSGFVDQELSSTPSTSATRFKNCWSNTQTSSTCGTRSVSEMPSMSWTNSSQGRWTPKKKNEPDWRRSLKSQVSL